MFAMLDDATVLVWCVYRINNDHDDFFLEKKFIGYKNNQD